MAKEAKIGMTVIAVLIGIFGYLLFRRLSRTEESPVVARADVTDSGAPDAPDDKSELPEVTDPTTPSGEGADVGTGSAVARYEDWNSASDLWPATAQEAVIQSDAPRSFTSPSGQAEPAPFKAASDPPASQPNAFNRTAGGGLVSDSRNDDWNRSAQQDPRMFTGSDDQQGELAESGAGQTPYQQDEPGQQLQNFPDAPGVLLPADETAYEASDSVQTAAAQARSPAGDSSRDYQSSQSGSSRGRTLPVYRPADYPQQQYSPQNTVPNFRESVLERSATAQTGPTRDYGPTQSGGGDFQNTNSAFGSTGGGRRADSGDRYVVQSRDNFWVISKRLYGSGAYFKALYEYNRRQYPRADQLRPGDVIQTPSKSILEQSYPELCPTLVQAEFATSPVGTKMVGQTVSGRMRSRLGGPIYVVEKGDTLFDIARYELGTATRWGEIYELNRDLLGDDMDYLKPGTELVLPPAVRDEPITRRRGTSLRR